MSSIEKKRENHLSAPMPSHLASFHSSPFYEEHLPPYQPPSYYELHETPKAVMDANRFYYPTPPPQTVTVHQIPTKSKDSCCWGW
ncbi:hypothetical protein BY458DRAFT_553730 [Sporodiniella umbellata]|nr:hypothetical protein BY458DRAFT_553730 [Sporodiniella umbellata]